MSAVNKQLALTQRCTFLVTCVTFSESRRFKLDMRVTLLTSASPRRARRSKATEQASQCKYRVREDQACFAPKDITELQTNSALNHGIVENTVQPFRITAYSTCESESTKEYGDILEACHSKHIARSDPARVLQLFKFTANRGI